MNRLVCFLLILLTTASLAEAQTRGRKTTRPPARKEIVVKIDEGPKTFGLSIERYVSSYDVNADGTAVQIWEMERRCSSVQCLGIANRLNHTYNADLEKIEVIEAAIINTDGKRVPLPASEIKLKPTPHAEAATAFSSLHEVDIKFEGLKIGESSYFKIRISTTKAMFDNQFHTMELFPQTFDWKSVEIDLSAPKGYEIYTEAPGLEGGEPVEENGRVRRRWTRKGLAAFQLEPAMWDIVSSSPRFSATSFKDHNALGRAFWENVKAKAVVTPAVKALADEITKGITDPKQQAYAIYDWVNRNIRYVLVVLDRGGWTPHSTTEILVNRFGDCKDYTTIIYALLKARSIESTPVLIRSDMGNWFPDVATPDYFNHAVLYIPSLGLIADATAPNTRLGLIPQSLVGKKAVLAGEQTGIFQLPQDNPDDNEMLSEVEIEMRPDGTLKAVSRNMYKGRMEMVFRTIFGNSVVRDNSELFVKEILAYFGVEGSGRLKKIGDPTRVGDPFTIEMEMEVPRYTTFTPRGKFTLPIGINLMNTFQIEELVRSETRKTNLIAGAMRIKERFIIKMPDPVSIETLPANIAVTNAVGRFGVEFRNVDRTIEVTREMVLSKDTIAPADYAKARELVKKAVDGQNVEIAYKADPSLLMAAAREVDRTAKSGAIPVKRGPATSVDTRLSATEVVRLENRLKTAPDDLEARKWLVRHYGSMQIKRTPKVSATYAAHRLWFTKNHPALAKQTIYGFGLQWSMDRFEGPEYEKLKAEWFAQVAANKPDAQVRLNAAEFFKTNDDLESSKQILIEGVSLYPDRYDVPLLLTELLDTSLAKLPKDAPAEKRAEVLRSIEQFGEIALQRLKSNRSVERDALRHGLLIQLTPAVFDLGKMDRAKELANELIREFAQYEGGYKFDDSSYIANIILGRVALRNGETALAKRHLAAAILAPARESYAALSKIDLELAKELFAKGEKDAVLEYLQMCENLSNLKTYPESYAVEIKSLKAWQEQIKQGKRPSFEFGKDAALP